MIQCPHCHWIITDSGMPVNDLVRMRDGEVVLYKRKDAGDKWQARYKTPDGKWHRISTKQVRIDDAKKVACETYDRARFRASEGLIAVSRRFRDVAKLAIQQMDKATAAGRGKTTFRDYKQVIEKHLIPFFGSTNIDKIDAAKMREFETWRVQKMGKEPGASTLNNHNGALGRVFDAAVAEGWIKQHQVPAFKTGGKKGERRPAFTMKEWHTISANLRHWVEKTRHKRSKEMRELLWDYVLILANTGMRPGTETQNLRWKHIRWYTDRKDKQKYIAISVDGKTGKRELIARHGCVDFLKRIQSRFPDLAKMSFDELLKAKVDKPVFRLRSGKQTNNLRNTFCQFLTAYNLLNDTHGDPRVLYSLRHTYATLRLTDGNVSIHQLAKQMGTSVKMLEQHYSHLEPFMVAAQLAGKRYDDKTKASTVSK